MLGNIEARGQGLTEIWMLGWYHQFKGQEFDPTVGDGEEQGSLSSGSPWGHVESVTCWSCD